jgi:hypothetical protein
VNGRKHDIDARFLQRAWERFVELDLYDRVSAGSECGFYLLGAQQRNVPFY